MSTSQTVWQPITASLRQFATILRTKSSLLVVLAVPKLLSIGWREPAET